MSEIIIIDVCYHKHNIVIDKENNAIYYMNKKEYDDKDICFRFDTANISISVEVFYELVKLLGLKSDKRILKLKDDSLKSIVYLQNQNNEKLVINDKIKKYMKKAFITVEDDSKYVKVPNVIYDCLIEALNKNNYKEEDFNNEYYVTKEEVFNNFDEIIRTYKYNTDYTFERYDYFDIELIKEKFIKCFNNDIDSRYFDSFCYLMMLLLAHYPLELGERERRLYENASHLFDGLAFGITDEGPTTISESFADVKHLYNELHQIKDGKVLIFYDFDHYNLKANQEIYEITILDKTARKYWMGYVDNPIFDFDMNYKRIDNYCTIDYIDLSDDEDDDWDDDDWDDDDWDDDWDDDESEKEDSDDESDDDSDNESDYNDYGNTKSYLPYDYYEKYTFDDSLKEKYFPKKIRSKIR